MVLPPSRHIRLLYPIVFHSHETGCLFCSLHIIDNRGNHYRLFGRYTSSSLFSPEQSRFLCGQCPETLRNRQCLKLLPLSLLCPSSLTSKRQVRSFRGQWWSVPVTLNFSLCSFRTPRMSKCGFPTSNFSRASRYFPDLQPGEANAGSLSEENFHHIWHYHGILFMSLCSAKSPMALQVSFPVFHPALWNLRSDIVLSQKYSVGLTFPVQTVNPSFYLDPHIRSEELVLDKSKFLLLSASYDLSYIYHGCFFQHSVSLPERSVFCDQASQKKRQWLL